MLHLGLGCVGVAAWRGSRSHGALGEGGLWEALPSARSGCQDIWRCTGSLAKDPFPSPAVSCSHLVKPSTACLPSWQLYKGTCWKCPGTGLLVSCGLLQQSCCPALKSHRGAHASIAPLTSRAFSTDTHGFLPGPQVPTQKRSGPRCSTMGRGDDARESERERDRQTQEEWA